MRPARIPAATRRIRTSAFYRGCLGDGAQHTQRVESVAPQAYLKFIPSAPAMGLGFVIPAWNAVSMFAGALAAAVFVWIFPDLARKRLVVIAAGLIVGESLAGVAAALWSIFS